MTRIVSSNKGDVEIDSQQQQEEPYSIARGREKQVHKAPQRYGFEDMVSFALVTSSGDPFTFKEATNRKDNDKWIVAMLEEMESLQKNKTWESSSMLTKLVPTDKFKSYLDLVDVCSL